MTEIVIVRSKIKEFAKDMNVASDFAEALNEKAVALINDAVKRAEANGRKTIQPRDL